MRAIALRILFYSLLTVAACTFLYPFMWMILTTFKPEIEVTDLALFPSRWTIQSYLLVFKQIPLGRAFLNSILVSGIVTGSVLVFSSLTGYALARLDFKGRKFIFGVILFTMMLPFQITLIPMYVLIVKFGWVNTYQALIVPAMISAFGILVFRQAFLSIPQALLDSARMDGCSDLRILFQIVWPLSRPTLVTVGIITFMGTWNDVLWPIIVIREQSTMTMPQMVALFAVSGQADGQMGSILAAATLLAVPVIIAYLFFQRYFMESMATSGVKG